VAGLELPDSYYAQLHDFYSQKRELFLRYLKQTGLPFTEPQGAYYVMVDISSLGFERDTDTAEWFVREARVAGVPGSSFFREPENRFIRFHFAKKEDTLRAAGEKLLRLSAAGVASGLCVSGREIGFQALTASKRQISIFNTKGLNKNNFYTTSV